VLRNQAAPRELDRDLLGGGGRVGRRSEIVELGGEQARARTQTQVVAGVLGMVVCAHDHVVEEEQVSQATL